MRLAHLYEHFPAEHRTTRRHRRFRILSGAALALERERFLAAGSFDEVFRNGFEDVELCQRLAAARLPDAEPRLACVPEAVVWHLCGQTPGRNAHEDHNRPLWPNAEPTIFSVPMSTAIWPRTAISCV